MHAYIYIYIHVYAASIDVSAISAENLNFKLYYDHNGLPLGVLKCNIQKCNMSKGQARIDTR